MPSTVVLLGPQRFEPTLASVVRALGIEEDLATVTAGWQEREDEDAELRDHLGARAVNPAALIRRTSALAIAGGHVAVLLNRLRLFGILALAEGRTIIAWSAGAMAVSDRIVLFHDSPPQGPGNPEVLGAGLGLFPG